MTLKVARGGTIPLTAYYRTGTGQLADPDNPRVDVIDANDVQVLTDAVPTRQSLGTFTYGYAVAIDAPLGVWKAHWTGVLSGVPESGDDLFEVMPVGSVSFSTASFASVEEFETRKGQVEAEDEATIAALLSDATALIIGDAGTSDEAWVTSPSSACPQSVKSICIEVAFRAWSNPAGVSSSTTGSTSVSFDRDAPDALFLTDAERRTIRREAKVGATTSVTLESPYSGDDLDDLAGADLPL